MGINTVRFPGMKLRRSETRTHPLIKVCWRKRAEHPTLSECAWRGPCGHSRGRPSSKRRHHFNCASHRRATVSAVVVDTRLRHGGDRRAGVLSRRLQRCCWKRVWPACAVPGPESCVDSAWAAMRALKLDTRRGGPRRRVGAVRTACFNMATYSAVDCGHHSVVPALSGRKRNRCSRRSSATVGAGTTARQALPAVRH